MKTKLFKIILLMLVAVAFSSKAEEKPGYHIRLSWIGDAEVDLIWRNPKNPDMNSPVQPLDCYDGQSEPDWGIIGQDFDNPKWTETKIGITNIQEVKAKTLMDVGAYAAIARIIDGEAVCHIDTLRANDKEVNERITQTLNAEDCNLNDDEKIVILNTRNELLYSRVLKFKQNKTKNKFLIKLNYTAIPDDLTTNEIARLFLNSEEAYSENNWESNKKQTKFFIDNPWTMKVIKRSGKQLIFIRGVLDNYYGDATIESTLLIGNYVGTNKFVTTKKAQYKYKLPK